LKFTIIALIKAAVVVIVVVDVAHHRRHRGQIRPLLPPLPQSRSK
jgi:hypothetical protein